MNDRAVVQERVNLVFCRGLWIWILASLSPLTFIGPHSVIGLYYIIGHAPIGPYSRHALARLSDLKIFLKRLASRRIVSYYVGRARNILLRGTTMEYQTMLTNAVDCLTSGMVNVFYAFAGFGTAVIVNAFRLRFKKL